MKPKPTFPRKDDDLGYEIVDMELYGLREHSTSTIQCLPRMPNWTTIWIPSHGFLSSAQEGYKP